MPNGLVSIFSTCLGPLDHFFVLSSLAYLKFPFDKTKWFVAQLIKSIYPCTFMSRCSELESPLLPNICFKRKQKSYATLKVTIWFLKFRQKNLPPNQNLSAECLLQLQQWSKFFVDHLHNFGNTRREKYNKFNELFHFVISRCFRLDSMLLFLIILRAFIFSQASTTKPLMAINLWCRNCSSLLKCRIVWCIC